MIRFLVHRQNKKRANPNRRYREKKALTLSPAGMFNVCVSPQRPEIHRGCRKCVSKAAGVQSAQREKWQQPFCQGQCARFLFCQFNCLTAV